MICRWTEKKGGWKSKDVEECYKLKVEMGDDYSHTNRKQVFFTWVFFKSFVICKIVWFYGSQTPFDAHDIWFVYILKCSMRRTYTHILYKKTIKHSKCSQFELDRRNIQKSVTTQILGEYFQSLFIIDISDSLKNEILEFYMTEITVLDFCMAMTKLKPKKSTKWFPRFSFYILNWALTTNMFSTFVKGGHS